jgi:alpha-tubulin suppressor-like RCC1 family protein
VCSFECTGGLLKCGDLCCGATQIVASRASTYALLSDGTLRAWGANESGQLGDGNPEGGPTPPDRSAPVAVALGTGVTATAVAAGPFHACAVLSTGAVQCWGRNTAGQVTGTRSTAAIHSPVASPVTSGALAVACGADHTCALLSSGAVTCWGTGPGLGPGPGAPLGAGSGAIAIVAGRVHTCALDTTGSVRCWGDNGNGQLGTGDTAPVALGSQPTRPISAGISTVAAAGDHTCATAAGQRAGALVCWGSVLDPTYNFRVPEPTPTVPSRPRVPPQPVVNFEVDRVSTGENHVCVRDALAPPAPGAFAVYCLGPASSLGQLGGPPPAEVDAVLVPLPSPASTVASGSNHNCAILDSGALACWGDNLRGQLGGGTFAQSQPAWSLVTPLGR